MHIQAPVFFVPEDLNDFIGKWCMVVSMGDIYVGSKLLKWDWDIDYKVFSWGEDLYDVYDISLTNFCVSLT